MKDEEQQQMLDQCLKLLVAAGYFRAGVSGLPPFDKIVGGMTWCVEMCCIDLDLDLMYNDSLTIGQKIGLTEHLVSVLPVLQCPHLLQPHQIQGLDAAHLLPVVQWLVRAALANRAQQGSLAQRVAALHSPASLATSPAAPSAPSSAAPPADSAAPTALLINTLRDIHVLHCCVRRWRVPTTAAPQQESVYNTLLEYSPGVPSTGPGQSAPAAVKAAEELTTAPAALLTEAALSAPLLLTTAADVPTLERRLAVLQGRAQALEERAQEVQQRRAQLTADISGASQALGQSRARLASIEASQQRESLQELKGLVREAEAVKKARQDLRQRHQQEAQALQQELTTLQEDHHKGVPSATQQALEDEVQQQRTRHARAREAAAAAAQRVFRLQYVWDDVPGRAELAQYRHRLAELTHLMTASEGETQKFNSLYETLRNSRLVMERHLKLLNGVSDSLHQTQGNVDLRSIVVKRADEELQRLMDTKAEAARERDNLDGILQNVNAGLQALQETARLYTRTSQSLLHHLAKNQQLLQLCSPSAAP